MSKTPIFDLLSDIQISSTWERCNNCSRLFPEESDFQLVSYIQSLNKIECKGIRVCNECCKPKEVFITELSGLSMKFSATTYEDNQMIVGFGSTEKEAIEDMRSLYAESFNKDIVSFKRA